MGGKCYIKRCVSTPHGKTVVMEGILGWPPSHRQSRLQGHSDTHPFILGFFGNVIRGSSQVSLQLSQLNASQESPISLLPTTAHLLDTRDVDLNIYHVHGSFCPFFGPVCHYVSEIQACVIRIVW